MLYLYSLLNLSASLLPSIERQVALIIIVCFFMEKPLCIRIIIKRGTNVLHHYHCGLPLEKLDIRIVICLLELSVASNLLCVCVVCALSTCVHYSSDLATKVRVIISYSVVQCTIQFPINIE